MKRKHIRFYCYSPRINELKQLTTILVSSFCFYQKITSKSKSYTDRHLISQNIPCDSATMNA